MYSKLTYLVHYNQEATMWQQLDEMFVRLWHKPLSILCSFTGKSNFFFARALNLLGYALQNTLVIYIVLVFSSVEAAFPGVILMWVIFLLNISTALSFDRKARVLEKQYVEGEMSEVLPSDSYVVSRPKMMICNTGVCILLWALHPLVYGRSIATIVAGGIGFVLIPISRYWLMDMQPPKKSWVRKGIEKLGELASRIHLPLPSPLPRPA